MNSRQLAKKIEIVLKSLLTNSKCIEEINYLRDNYELLISKMPDLLTSNATDLARNIEAYQREIRESINSTKEISPQNIFVSLNEIKQAFNTFAIVDGINKDDLKDLEINITSFLKSYESFILINSFGNLMQMYKNSVKIQTQLNSLYVFLASLTTQIKGSDEKSPYKGDTLELYFYTEQTFNHFTAKCNSILALYEEICSILNLSIKEFPLSIIKIETGSLWLVLLGHPKVISLITDFLRSASTFVYQQFTKEGRITQIPKKIESVEAILNISNKLKEIGADTSEIDKHIQKSTLCIASELNNILDSEPKIDINNTKYSVNMEQEKKFLKASQKLLSDK